MIRIETRGSATVRAYVRISRPPMACCVAHTAHSMPKLIEVELRAPPTRSLGRGRRLQGKGAVVTQRL